MDVALVTIVHTSMRVEQLVHLVHDLKEVAKVAKIVVCLVVVAVTHVEKDEAVMQRLRNSRAA